MENGVWNDMRGTWGHRGRTRGRRMGRGRRCRRRGWGEVSGKGWRAG